MELKVSTLNAMSLGFNECSRNMLIESNHDFELSKKEIGMDNGSEFKKEFLGLCANMGMTPKRENSWNPQSNSILERIHQVLSDGLRVYDLENIDIDPEDDDPFDEYLSAVSYAIRSSYHQTHGFSPAQIVYGRDMFIDSQPKIGWTEI